jgi:hypothetical protein
MLKSFAAGALIGVGMLATVGGATALAASPSPDRPKAVQPGDHHPAAKDNAHGVVTKVSDSQLTIERTTRDKTTKAETKASVTYKLNKDTQIYRWDDKTHRLGTDAIKLGDKVSVRSADEAGQKVAKRVVIALDGRKGTVLSKGTDSFVLHTAKKGDVKVLVTDKTKFTHGREAGSFADLKVGDRVMVLGKEDSSHNFNASAVRYGPAGEKPKTGSPKQTPSS